MYLILDGLAKTVAAAWLILFLILSSWCIVVVVKEIFNAN
jgi:hypothetical protein